MTKAELRAGLEKARREFESDRILGNEYALLLDELLSGYLGVRRVSVLPGELEARFGCHDGDD